MSVLNMYPRLYYSLNAFLIIQQSNCSYNIYIAQNLDCNKILVSHLVMISGKWNNSQMVKQQVIHIDVGTLKKKQCNLKKKFKSNNPGEVLWHSRLFRLWLALMWIHFKAWLLRFQFGSLTVSLILVSFHLNNLWIVTATLTDSVLYYWIKPGIAGSGITSVYSSYVSVRICFIVDTSLKY